MSHTKNIAPEALPPSYEDEMSTLRERLAGRPYVKEVLSILPELTKAHIRNVVNGRCSNALVLAALKIVVHKLDSAAAGNKNRLSELAALLEKIGVPA